MNKFLSRIGCTIKDKFNTFKKMLIGGKKKKGYKSNLRGAAKGSGASHKAAPSPMSKTPVIGAPGSVPIRTTAGGQASRPRAAKTKQHSKVVAFFSALNKKRFSMVAGVIAAAVLIPVIAVSANGGANHVKAQAAEVPGTQLAAQAGEPVDPAAATVADVPVDLGVLPEAEPTPEPTPPPKQYLNLIPESNHGDVVKLQERLMELHYMENDEPTDYYGPQTQHAVSYFQRKNELPIDGVAGETTQDILFSENAKPYSVTVGGEGLDVENIQERLQDLGYPADVTGYFGTETESAVKYFQRMNGLDPDGSVGFYTKEMLFSDEAETSEEYKKPSSSGGKKSSSSGGGGGGGTTHVANPGSVEGFIDAALQQVGKTYVLGGKGSDVFDCSGLVYYALQASGNGIGYMTSGGWAGSSYSTIGSMGDLQRGDVICFKGHVGIYLGGGQMVDASSSRGVVRTTGLGSWAQNNFICGKRPL